MLWFVFIYFVIFAIAASGNKNPILKREKYEESLQGMNDASKKKIVCGILTLIAALLVIVDACLKKNTPVGYTHITESQLFKVDYSDDGPMFTLAVSWIVTIAWLLWLFMNINYKEKNARKLDEKMAEAEAKRAEIEDRIATQKKENEQFIAKMSAQLGAPGKIVKIRSELYKDGLVVFPVSQNIYVNARVIPFNQLIGCEIKDESYTTVTGTKEAVSRTSTGSAVGRAVVGGLLAGPAGAIIGGSTAKTKTEIIDNTQTITHHHYFAIINLTDLATPTVKVDCGKTGSRVAEEIKALITGIIAKKSAAQVSAKSVADELAKLANLKAQGFLTDEEFAQQKRLLLASEQNPIAISSEAPKMIESVAPEEYEDPFEKELVEILISGSILDAIKRYKDETRCDLVTAKNYIEDLKARKGL